MTALLLLGFLIGMRHALDADHIAAIATISSQQQSLKASLRHGLVWGQGHTTMLLLFGSVIIWMDASFSEQLAASLERAVGIMLMVLGVYVLLRLYQQRVHFHSHRHDGDVVHLHAHSHANDVEHSASRHERSHQSRYPFKTFCIGLMHGMAGSSALILLTMNTVDSLWMGIAYILVFGIGSMLGMGILSVIISLPFRLSAKRLTWLHNGLQATIGMLTIVLGFNIALN